MTEWAAPAGLGEHERFLSRQAVPSAKPEALDSYRELLAEAGPMSVGHEALVTVTVDQRRVPGGRPSGAATHGGDVAAMLEELRLVSMRLEAANLAVGPPLSATQTAEAIRLRCDPSCRPRLEARGATLAELTGLVSRYSAAPLASLVDWGQVRSDASLHRSYWVAEWPRLEVGPVVRRQRGRGAQSSNRAPGHLGVGRNQQNLDQAQSTEPALPARPGRDGLPRGNGSAVIFGGDGDSPCPNSSIPLLNDTWIWKGTDWKQKAL